MEKKLETGKIDPDIRQLLEDLNAVGRLTEDGFISYDTYVMIRKEVMNFIGENYVQRLPKGRGIKKRQSR
jgi:hypothetical protein